MDYDEHDDGDEEMAIPSGFEQLGNSSASLATPAGAGGFRAKSGDGLISGSHHHYHVGGGAGGGRKSGNGANHAGTRYRECLKNHAVGIGGHALDGCGEFMAAGEEGTLDALKCAACNCHRNFHRKETGGDAAMAAAAYAHHHGDAAATAFSPYYRTPAGYLHMTRPQPLALPSNSRGEDDDVSNPSSGGGAPNSNSKKRFRTKFTPEQKDKMLAFAEQVGWRIQKQDEPAVQQFCAETAVKRHVLKVWMHNNKHTLGKKP